jgi:hypothetical protein
MVADATLADGKLMALAATTAPARLKGQTFDAALGAGASPCGRAATAWISTPRSRRRRLVVGSLTLTGARLGLTGQAPYPDLQKRRGDGAVTLRASLAGSLATAGQRLGGAPNSRRLSTASRPAGSTP